MLLIIGFVLGILTLFGVLILYKWYSYKKFKKEMLEHAKKVSKSHIN